MHHSLHTVGVPGPKSWVLCISMEILMANVTKQVLCVQQKLQNVKNQLANLSVRKEENTLRLQQKLVAEYWMLFDLLRKIR